MKFKKAKSFALSLALPSCVSFSGFGRGNGTDNGGELQ